MYTDQSCVAAELLKRRAGSGGIENMKNKISLTDFLIYHKESRPISFHMPGHKGRSTLYGIYGFGDFVKTVMGNDITEIPGADALQQPRERIKDIMNGYAGLYGVKHTELLVNGSSTGLMAAILATVPRGDTLLMGRNSHKSVYGALRLGGINPSYIMPELDEETGLQLGLDPDRIEAALMADPMIKAVLVTSPNYYGVLSDIERIADIVHLHGRILIVDQAHGAHLKFFDYLRRDGAHGAPQPAGSSQGLRGLDSSKYGRAAAGGNSGNPSSDPERLILSAGCRAAENCGADIVVDSTHKTLLSFTGSAILNICTERPDVPRIAELIRMLQTTSPSYLLMGSLDINQQILRMDGYNLVKSWAADVEYFYREAARIRGLNLIRLPELDNTKINLTMSALGLSGDQLAEELRKRNIWVELTHGGYAMMMTGIGNERGDYEDMLAALRELSVQYGGGIRRTELQDSDSTGASGGKIADSTFKYTKADSKIAEVALQIEKAGSKAADSASQAVNSSSKAADSPSPARNPALSAMLEQCGIPDRYETVPLYSAEGRVLYESLVPYPPGSPIACPGEVLSRDVILYVRDQLVAEHVVLGVDEEGRIKVAPECEDFKEV